MASASLVAQTPDLAWARGMGSYSSEEMYCVVADRHGNMYVSGFHGATTDLDPGPGVLSFTGTGHYIQKYDSAGILIWTNHYAGNFFSVYEMKLDSTHTRLYVTGSFQGTVDFDAGPGTTQLVGLGTGGNGFLMKMDTAGGFLWAKHVVASGMGGWPNSMAIGAQDVVVLAGQFYGTADFDPSGGVSTKVSAGGSDAFVGKYDSSGTLIWIGSFGAQFTDEPVDVVIDPWGDIISTGRFTQTPDFDPGPGVLNFTALSGMDGYVQKLDPNGALIWAGPMGGLSANCLVRGLACTPSGELCVVGAYFGTVDFDPGPGTHSMSWAGGLGWDIFVLKLDTAGQHLWSHSIGSTYWDQAYCVTADMGGNIYVGTYFTLTVDFDPGPGVVTATTPPYYADIAIVKYDALGIFKWLAVAGGGSSDYVNEIALDPHNDLLAVGSFQGVADFDPGPARDTLIGMGNLDACLYKLLQCSNTLVVTDTGCNSYVYNHVNYSQSGVYYQILPQPSGCDSVVELHLSIPPATADTLVLSGCDSVQVNGVDYFQSGQYTQSLTNAAGCDSTLTLEIAIHHEEITHLSATSCDSFTLNGFTYPSPGVYVQSLSTVFGCDSTLQLTLILDTLNAQVLANGPTLSAVISGAAYQWLDCENGLAPIPGANGQSFTAASNGTFAVQVTVGNCVDTSGCVPVIVIGREDPMAAHIAAFPNPCRGKFALDLSQLPGESIGVNLYSMQGVQVFSTCTTGGSVIDIAMADLPAGLYLVTVRSNAAAWKGKALLMEHR